MLFVLLDLGFFDICCICCMFTILNININNSRISNYIHVLLPIFIYCTIHQLYIFYEDYIVHEINTIKSLKINNAADVFKNLIVNVNNTITVNKNIFILFDVHKNNFDISSGVFKNIFEKDIFMQKNYIIELYSYNLQKLLQPVGLIIFVLLYIILYILVCFLKHTQVIRLYI